MESMKMMQQGFPTPSTRHRAACLTILLAIAVVPVACTQNQRPQSFDKRNFTGTWDRYPQALDTQRDPTVSQVPMQIPPPPLKPEFLGPYQANQKRIEEADARGEPIATGYTHCLPDGMPAMMMAMFPMEVLQTPGQITIIQEAFSQVRRIYLDEEVPAIDDAEPGFWGHSAARWEGDVLVVETVGIKDIVRMRNVPHSAQMRIQERIRVLGPESFENQVSVIDPEYLTGPWSWTWSYQRKVGYKMYEYVCEDNREFADPATGATRLRIKER